MARKKKKRAILTEEKWRQDPNYYRKCFALRLFYLIVGPAKLKRLPRVLRRLGIEIPPGWTPADPWPPGDYCPPDIVFPPDWTPEENLPPGVVIPPDVVFPPDWTPGDPLPPGVVMPPGVSFPPGWTAGDPMPPGVVMPPGVSFPPGWTAGDPMPPGVVMPPGVSFPPGWTADDPMPAGGTISPSAVFPAGWTPADPWPPGMAAFPSSPETEEWGATSPTFLDIATPGSMATKQPAPPAPVEYSVDCMSSVSDGIIDYEQYTDNWDELRNSAAGNFKRDDRTKEYTIAGVYRSDGYNVLERAFFFFDLSAIPAAAEILSATLKVSGYWKGGNTVCAQKGTQADPITLNDYQAFEGDPFGTVIWEYSSASPYPVNAIELNAAGLSFVDACKGGVAKICLREYGHDYLNVEPAVNDDFENGGWFTEAAEEGNRPRITITYQAYE